MFGENYIFSVSIDVIRGNSVYENSAVVDAETFAGDWETLISGEWTPCEWDDDNNVTAYAVLSDLEEYDDELRG